MLGHLQGACADLRALLESCGDRMLDGEALTEAGIQLSLLHFMAHRVAEDDATLRVRTEYAVRIRPKDTRYADLVVVNGDNVPLLVVELKYARLGFLKRLAWTIKPSPEERDQQLATHRAAIHDMKRPDLLNEQVRGLGSAAVFQSMEIRFVTNAEQAADQLRRFSRHWGADTGIVYALVLVVGDRVLLREWDATSCEFEEKYNEYRHG